MGGVTRREKRMVRGGVGRERVVRGGGHDDV